MLLSATLQAAATGTLFCTIDDRNLSFNLLGHTSIEHGAILDVHDGSLKLKAARSVGKEIEFPVSMENIFMQWDFDSDLRFAIRIEDPDRSREIVLAIIAARNEKLEKYLGRYVLQLVGGNKTERLEGPISCEGD